MSQPEKTHLDHLIASAEAARNATKHVDTITQNRMYNCLFCASILMLAWATTFAVSKPELAGKRAIVLFCLSGLNLVISVGYARLGGRARAYLEMYLDLETSLDAELPENLQISTATQTLRTTGRYQRKSEYKRDEFIEIPSWSKDWPTTTIFPIWIPGLLAVFSGILLAIPFLHL